MGTRLQLLVALFPGPHVLLLAVWKAEGESLCDAVLYGMSQHRAKLSPLAFHTASSGMREPGNESKSSVCYSVAVGIVNRFLSVKSF